MEAHQEALQSDGIAAEDAGRRCEDEAREPRLQARLQKGAAVQEYGTGWQARCTQAWEDPWRATDRL